MDNSKVVLYSHAGSANHGCEALADTIISIIDRPVILLSYYPCEDIRYSLNEKATIVDYRRIERKSLLHYILYVWKIISGDGSVYAQYSLGAIINKGVKSIAISIGGDNYCYDNMIDEMINTNKVLNRRGSKTILLGCSIEPSMLSNLRVLEDLKTYQVIYSRESMTVDALREVGIESRLYPDTAFVLDTVYNPLPEKFLEYQTVGINISPLVIDSEQSEGIVLRNYRVLIDHILDTSDMNIALIPHVVKEGNDDRSILKILYDDYEITGRLVLIEDAPASVIKGYIARCRFFIGARTHSTIAAYSSTVPTLVVGYSIKAIGIAKDIFGEWDNYVLPVQGIDIEDSIMEGYRWILANELSIKSILELKMIEYKHQIDELSRELNKLITEID